MLWSPCLEDGYSISEPSERGDLVGSSVRSRVLVCSDENLFLSFSTRGLRSRIQNPRWKNSRLTGSDCPCGNKQRVRLYFDILIEGTLEVKPPTIRTDGKAEVGRVREEKTRREKIREEKVRRKKMQPREKVQKSRFKFNVFFQSFVALEGRKVG